MPQRNFGYWLNIAERIAFAALAGLIGLLLLSMPVHGAPLTCYESVRHAYVRELAAQPHPVGLRRAIGMMGECYGLPSGLLLAIAERENGPLDPDVPDGEAGEVGLMHMKPATVLQVLRRTPGNWQDWPETPESLTKLRRTLRGDPIAAMYWAARYIAEVLTPICGQSRECIATGYNGGAGAATYAMAVARRSAQLAGGE